MKAVLILMLFCLPVYAQPEPAKVLILPFENATGDSQNDDLSIGLPDILTVCFSNYSDQIITLDRDSLDAGLTEQSLSLGKLIDGKSRQSIGRVVGANLILKGSVIIENNQLLVQALLFDVAGTQLHQSVSGTIEGNIVESLCRTVAKPLLAGIRDKPAKPIEAQAEALPEKQQWLIDGLNHYYNGEYAQSFAPLLKLVKKFPNDPIPHFWLAQSFNRAGLHDFAVIRFQDFMTRFPNSKQIIKVRARLEALKPTSTIGQDNEQK